MKLNGEERRGFKKEKLIEHFFLCIHNGAYEDFKVQIIGHCDPNDQETLENFWIFYLDKEEHADMRPEVNSNRFEISLSVKVSLQCKATSSLAFT